MGVSCSVDEFSRFKAAHLCKHESKECVRCYVERHAKENVRAALVKLAGQLAAGYVELEKAVTRGQRHFVYLSGIPCRHKYAPGVRIMLNLVDYHR